MADISDVDSAFVAAITAAIYPGGTSSPSAIVLGGTPINARVYPGWPLPENLDADMAAGTPPGSAPVVNVSVWAQPGMERNVTRFPRDWIDNPPTPCSMTATLSNLTITIGGTVTAGHYITIHVAGKAYSYAALSNDTLATIAAALGALLAVNLTVAVSGAAITLPAVAGGEISIRTAAPGSSIRELERSMQRYAVTIWAPNNATRVAAAKVIRPALAAIDFFTLPDNFAGMLKYESSTDIDRSGKQSVSCRDIFYWVEYPTTQTMVAFPITTFVTEIEADNPITEIKPLPLSSFTPATINIS